MNNEDDGYSVGRIRNYIIPDDDMLSGNNKDIVYQVGWWLRLRFVPPWELERIDLFDDTDV